MTNKYETVEKVYVEFPSRNLIYYGVGDMFPHKGYEYAIKEIRVDENEVAIYIVPCGLSPSHIMPTLILAKRYIGAPFHIDYMSGSNG